MNRTMWRLCLCCVAGVAVADGKQPPANPPRADRPKSKIEMPAQRILARQTAPAGGAFVNPKVQPGKVHWHKDFTTACRAAEKSGKPVLLFQMMGKLDDQFC